MDVYVAELKRLCYLSNIKEEGVMQKIFISGLPKDVSAQLRTQISISNLSFNEILDLTRIIISQNGDDEVMCSAVRKNTNQVRCFKCNEIGHISRN